MRKILLVEVLLASVIFSGCAALTSLGGGSTSSSTASSAETVASAVAPGPSLFNFVGRSTKFQYVSPSALLVNSRNIEESLIKEQCMFHTADPPFLVPAFDQKWMFVGHMNQGSSIDALEYKTILTLGLTGPQQLNAWPVSLVSLSDFSDDYLAQRLPVVGKSQPDVRSDVLAEYINNAKYIRGVTDMLIQKYNPDTECPNSH